MTLSQQEFLFRARKKHGKKYNYSKSVYRRKDLSLIITCKTHGDFRQRPDNHWNGAGCPSCQHVLWGEARRTPVRDFIRKAQEKHSVSYDYSKVKYKRNDSKIKIGCPYHGYFIQRVQEHLKGSGCPACFGNVRLTTKEFISRAKAVHLNRFKYPLTAYKNMSTKVVVTCPVKGHGNFRVTPAHHLYLKNGCPRCSSSKGELEVEAWLINQKIPYERQKTFDSCRRKRKLRFDFYVEKHNVLIEYDGDQHRTEGSFFSSKLKLIQERDHIKNQWAQENGITVLRIPSRRKINSVLGSFFKVPIK